jgi:hypothetical protein
MVVAGHASHKQTLLVHRIDDPEFFDCCFQRRRLIGCFDDPDECAGRTLDGVVNFPLDRVLGRAKDHGLMLAFAEAFEHASAQFKDVPIDDEVEPPRLWRNNWALTAVRRR